MNIAKVEIVRQENGGTDCVLTLQTSGFMLHALQAALQSQANHYYALGLLMSGNGMRDLAHAIDAAMVAGKVKT